MSPEPVTTSQGKDKVRRPSGPARTMIIFYFTIPLMILGTAIAIVPLVFAMRHQYEWEDPARQPAAAARREAERLAA
jgi:hypothetical protein